VAIVFSFMFVVVGLMILLGHDPLRLVQRIVMGLRTGCFYLRAAYHIVGQYHTDILAWARQQARLG